MARRAMRSLVPGVQGLEDRALQTVISPLAFGRHPSATATVRPSETGSTGIGSPSPSQYLDPATLTPRGLAQAKFTAVVVGGPFQVRSPVYVGQLANLTYLGKIESNQFLHGTLLMQVETPNSPGGTTSGIASLRNRNVAATGSVVTLDLGSNAINSAGTGQQVPTILDSKGRPIQMGFNVNTNASGGSYAASFGQGTVTISYGRRGTATMLFKGYVMTNQVSDITAYNLAKFG